MCPLPPSHVAAAEVNRPERDLTPVQVQTAYDFHWGLLELRLGHRVIYHACAVEAPLHVIFG